MNIIENRRSISSSGTLVPVFRQTMLFIVLLTMLCSFIQSSPNNGELMDLNHLDPKLNQQEFLSAVAQVDSFQSETDVIDFKLETHQINAYMANITAEDTDSDSESEDNYYYYGSVQLPQPTLSPTNPSPTRFPTVATPTLYPTGLPPSSQTSRPSALTTTFPTLSSPTRYPTASLPTIYPTQSPPTNAPSPHPTVIPTKIPTSNPTVTPSSVPTLNPTEIPTMNPTTTPSTNPTSEPTLLPSTKPTVYPTTSPSFTPSDMPTVDPSTSPTSNPTNEPTPLPSYFPTFSPTDTPTAMPSNDPSYTPTTIPSIAPSSSSSTYPTSHPTIIPTNLPTYEPSADPTILPSSLPTQVPSANPSSEPSSVPSALPSCSPSQIPTSLPSGIPSYAPSDLPTSIPTNSPSNLPTNTPSCSPTIQPSSLLTQQPSILPTMAPSAESSSSPTYLPTETPSLSPTFIPSSNPSSAPSLLPSIQPTTFPSASPTVYPTSSPSFLPSNAPSTLPSSNPTNVPTLFPSVLPTYLPSAFPTMVPSNSPSSNPSTYPTLLPSTKPSRKPTSNPSSCIPSSSPSNGPTNTPSACPSVSPTALNTLLPSSLPSFNPTDIPSIQPTSIATTADPSCLPTLIPSTTPSEFPSPSPTLFPSSLPTANPTYQPTPLPSSLPTKAPIPTRAPTRKPFAFPTFFPTEPPTLKPTGFPTFLPSSEPTALPPTKSPTFVPSANPTAAPTVLPTLLPSAVPTINPTSSPTRKTRQPSAADTDSPTNIPESLPTLYPTILEPTGFPSPYPTFMSTGQPILHPTIIPTQTMPTIPPTNFNPTFFPVSTNNPSTQPTTYVPSAVPTSAIPTKYPAAAFWSSSYAGNCTHCDAGSYVTPDGPNCCEKCNQGSYSAHLNSMECTACSYPYTNLADGSAACDSVFVNSQQISLYVIGGLIGFSMLFGIFHADRETRLNFIVMIIPVLDVASDFVVLLAVTFYNRALFGLSAVFFTMPSLYFIYILYNEKKYPVMIRKPFSSLPIIWLHSSSSSASMLPQINGQAVGAVLNNIPIIGTLAIICLWASLIMTQITYLGAIALLSFLNVPFQMFWLFVGCALFQSSLWSINRVYRLWFYVWSGIDISPPTNASRNRSMKANMTSWIMQATGRGSNKTPSQAFMSVDPVRLKTSLNYRLGFETVFQLILQPINLILLNGYGYSTLIGIMSILISIASIFNHFFYFYYWLPAYLKSMENKLTVNERNLAMDKDWLSLVKTYRRSMKPADLKRVRAAQSKKCFDILTLIGDRHPEVKRVLSQEHINSPDDLLNLKARSMDNIIDAVPNRHLRDQVMTVLSNFYVDDDSSRSNQTEKGSVNMFGDVQEIFSQIINFLFGFKQHSKDEKVLFKIDVQERDLSNGKKKATGISTDDANKYERKRQAESKRCWEMLMLVAEQYPYIRTLLADEKVLSHGDLVFLSGNGRKAIVNGIDRGDLRDQVTAMLANFFMDDSVFDDEDKHDDDASTITAKDDLVSDAAETVTIASTPSSSSTATSHWLSFITNYWNHSSQKQSEFKIRVKERNLNTRPLIDNQLGCQLLEIERKRREQTKQCWDLLMLASDDHPQLLKVLAAEKILSHGDILDLSLQSRDAILQAVPPSTMHSKIGCIFSALSENVFDQINVEESQQPPHNTNPNANANDSFCDNGHNNTVATNGGEFQLDDGVYVRGDFSSKAQIFANISSYVSAYLEHSAAKSSEFKVNVRERSLGNGKKLMERKSQDSTPMDKEQSSQIAGLYLSSGDAGSSRYEQTRRCYDLLIGVGEQQPNLRNILTKENITSHGKLAHLSTTSRMHIIATLPRSIRNQMRNLLDNFNTDATTIDHDVALENDQILDALSLQLRGNDESNMFSSLPNIISGVYNAVCGYLDHQVMKNSEFKIDIKERDLVGKCPMPKTLGASTDDNRQQVNFFSNIYQRKCFAQSKDLWDILMLLSEQHPEVCKALATHHILLSKDLIRITPKARNAIIDALYPTGKVADDINKLLKNFALDDQSLVAQQSDDILEKLSVSLTSRLSMKSASSRGVHAFFPGNQNPLCLSTRSIRHPVATDPVNFDDISLDADLDVNIRNHDILSKNKIFTFDDDAISEDSDFEIDDFDSNMDIYLSENVNADDMDGKIFRTSTPKNRTLSTSAANSNKSRNLPRSSSMREESINFGSDYHLELSAKDCDLAHD